MSNEDGWETIDGVECLLVMDASDRKVYITRNPPGIAFWVEEGLEQHSWPGTGMEGKPLEHYQRLTMKTERNAPLSVLVECVYLMAGHPRPVPPPEAKKETG